MNIQVGHLAEFIQRVAILGNRSFVRREEAQRGEVKNPGGVRELLEDNPVPIAAQLARRDATGIYSDWLHVMVDSYRDRRTSFRFSVNPRSVQKDVLEFDDRNEDANWDAVWQVATVVDSLGWTAEYRIPFSQLRFGGKQKGEERLWGIQIMRDIARRNERDRRKSIHTGDPSQ